MMPSIHIATWNLGRPGQSGVERSAVIVTNTE